MEKSVSYMFSASDFAPIQTALLRVFAISSPHEPFFFLLRYLSGNASFSLRRKNQGMENKMCVGGLVVRPVPSPVDLNTSIGVLGVASTKY